MGGRGSGDDDAALVVVVMAGVGVGRRDVAVVTPAIVVAVVVTKSRREVDWVVERLVSCSMGVLLELGMRASVEHITSDNVMRRRRGGD
eukprot:CAMPEP_0172507182 /NCGR_PEP_ID=MMETSP1066-20121228/202029_1 /TAXON_ID=671091 /ORGANISM="Coscinodiscus wailesii, Strain CCMP2513" /LENGTH=88 /DNA_ID=CAMNT_0013284639 /DNA_START=98 /DNA_END=364 /DNA_ORIENTATION=-